MMTQQTTYQNVQYQQFNISPVTTQQMPGFLNNPTASGTQFNPIAQEQLLGNSEPFDQGKHKTKGGTEGESTFSSMFDMDLQQPIASDISLSFLNNDDIEENMTDSFKNFSLEENK